MAQRGGPAQIVKSSAHFEAGACPFSGATGFCKGGATLIAVSHVIHNIWVKK
jgi:hypothetical protein